MIDTILRSFPVPELYLQLEVDEAGAQKQIVVDGQQRLRACLEFLEGRFALSGEHSPEHAGQKFDDLEPETKKRFFDYRFVVRVLPTMPEPELRDIFARLNRNVVALNAQELRHATYWGPFIKLVEELADDEFWTGSGLFTPNDIRRMLDVEYVSEMVIAYLHGHQNKKDSLDHWYELYETEFEEAGAVQSVFRAVVGEISQLLPSLGRTRWSKKSDFYTLFLVLGKNEQWLPLPSDLRGELVKVLLAFGQEVDAKVRDSELATSDEVRDYTVAVSRAASDLGNRIARDDALSRRTAAIWRAATDARAPLPK